MTKTEQLTGDQPMTDTTTRTTAVVVERYYELANAGEWEAWCDLFAPDQQMDEQLAGHIEGREQLRTMMRDFPRTYTTFANRPLHLVIDHERAAVMSHISARTVAGASIEVDVCNYFEIVDGEITYLKNVHDTAPFTQGRDA